MLPGRSEATLLAAKITSDHNKFQYAEIEYLHNSTEFIRGIVSRAALEHRSSVIALPALAVGAHENKFSK